MNKPLNILLWIVGAILGLALLAVIVLNVYFRISYGDFYKAAHREFKIPGLSDGFTPQGLTRCEDGTFLTCGYQKDGGASRIYRIGDNATYIALKNEDGTPDFNHGGGCAVYGDWLYLTDEAFLNVYRLDAVRSAAAGSALAPVYRFPTDYAGAFVHVEGDTLYLGEFYREENYPTDDTHHMTTDAGDAHFAVMAVYALSPDAEYGFASETPEYVYSIPGLAQGLCITDSGRLCLSTSYGTAPSHLSLYENPVQYPADGTLFIAGATVPLYYLDGSHLDRTVTLFPMSEELYYADGKVYIMCESASNKYVFGKLTGNGTLYSFEVE